ERERTDWEFEQALLLIVTGHWVAVRGRPFVDTWSNGTPVRIADAPRRRKRVCYAYRVEMPRRGLHPLKAPLPGPARPRLAPPRPRRPRHRLRPYLHLPQENQRLHCPGRTAPRHQGGRRGNLA